MVYVNVAFRNQTIVFPEIQSTNHTTRAVVLYAFSSGFLTTLVGVDQNLSRSTLDHLVLVSYLFWYLNLF